MSTLLRPAVLAAFVLIVAGCAGSAASRSPSTSAPRSSAPSAPLGSPSGGPTSTPGAVGALEHATGPTDVILRYEEGGGLMMPAWNAASAPSFTLYGDGSIIFRNTAKDPIPAIGSVIPIHPFRTVKMNEEQVQALLDYALREGGLAAARPEYLDMMVSDQPTAVFTVNAGGLAKKVSVYGLGYESPEVPDLLARKTFAKLRDHLVDIDQGGAVKTAVYAPDRYRAILLEGQPGAPDQKAWPWKDIKNSEFVSDGDPNAFQLPARVVTNADVKVLGLEPYEGGFIGLPLAGPADGKFYSLSLRPLLPEDTK
jgi:hypothetical protein